MNQERTISGSLRKAPESFLNQNGIKAVVAEAKSGRRDFIRGAFAAAAAGAAVSAAMAQSSPAPAEAGDPNILNLPAHSKGLGQGVAPDGSYGKPSRYESAVQRRQRPGLTQTTQASVSFAPLQSLFGIVTPSGLHFERHHQGWWDLDSSKHRLMVNGMVKSARVFTLDEIMRVKYLRRIEVGDMPYASRDEAVQYIDLQPDGLARQYTSIQECKSVVTTPSGGQALLDQGFYGITGLAWSGRGKVKKVDVSVDGGRNWRTARLETPVLSKALTRFNLDWVWDGKPAIVQSRAMDETGFVQPTYKQLRAVGGTRSIYHNNAIQSWLVQENGEARNVQVA